VPTKSHSKSNTQRTHIVIPQPLVEAIDLFVGKRGRSQFITQAAEKELKRHRLIKTLKEAAGCWTDANHPELRHGSSRYIERLRQESDRRQTS
jgi:metal-responsive CopG/Arc/MetJ family transcriptional regulator